MATSRDVTCAICDHPFASHQSKRCYGGDLCPCTTQAYFAARRTPTPRQRATEDRAVILFTFGVEP